MVGVSPAQAQSLRALRKRVMSPRELRELVRQRVALTQMHSAPRTMSTR
jgi:hypothetical protein